MQKNILFVIASLFTATTALAQPAANAIPLSGGNYLVNYTKKKSTTPTSGDVCKVEVQVYVGDSLMMDTRANSSTPVDLPMPNLEEVKAAGRPIPLIFEALAMTHEGDSISFYQVVDSTMRQQIPPALRAEKYVKYNLRLADIVTAAEQAEAKKAAEGRFTVIEAQVKATIAQYASGQLANKLTQTPSGLKVMIVEPGTGRSYAKGDQVFTHYYGALPNGNMFDNSFQRGEPLPFALGIGQMIPGFDEAAAMLRQGGKAYAFIPSALGYGEQGTPDGSIPPNSEIIFYIEMQ
jgi:FKBP-type peptidyl-prolyl cis-trans isomerase FkpA